MANINGLLGNPMLQAGMGLLANRYDSRINPYASAMNGLNNASAYQMMERQRRQEDEDRARYEKAIDELTKVVGPTAPVAMGPPGPQGMNMQPQPNPNYDPLSYALAQTGGFESLAKLQASLGQGMDPTAPIKNLQYRKVLEGQLARGEITQEDLDRFDTYVRSPYHAFDPGSGVVTRIDATGGVSRFNDPLTVGTERGVAESAKVERETANQFNLAYPELHTAATDSIVRLGSLREEMNALPGTGPIEGPILEKLDAQYQEMEAELTMEALATIGILKEQGVSLTPITERELAILMKPSPSLSKFKGVNINLLNKRIARWEKVKARLEHQKAFIDSGGKLNEYTGMKDNVSIGDD